MTSPPHHVCPASHSGWFDSSFRRLLQSPKKIFGSNIRPGDTVLDAGCGPGYFTRAMARMVGENGRVIAVDLQEEMLEKLRERATSEGLISRIRVIRATVDSLNLPGDAHVSFALAFYLVHEVPDQGRLFAELARVLVPGGTLLVVEPAMRVAEQEFLVSCDLATNNGFQVIGRPKILFSRSALLKKGDVTLSAPTGST
jgi:ubiquinone/menaquinone biosynthesis C-methylase UbiE